MTAFMLVCYMNLKLEGGIYFKNVNDCINFKQILNNQTIMKDKEEDIYQCMCKLVPNIDSEKERVY
jgi:hypothetical protein